MPTEATQTEESGPQLAAEARTEAAEIKADIKETRAEAAEAREDGDTARAAQLEKRLDSLETDLKSVLSQLTTLVQRPFHPAPEERTDTTSAAGTATDDKGTAATSAAGDGQPAKPRGRRPSRAFFGSRADYDD